MWKEFCENTSLQGYKYIVDEDRNFFERFLWVLCNIALLIITLYLVVVLWFTFNDNPIITSLQTTTYPVNQVPFPGIALCNTNKISKKKAVQFAKKLMGLDKTLNETAALSLVRIFGSMYDFEVSDVDKLLRLQSLLDILMTTSGNKVPNLEYHPKSIVKNLITNCDELLTYCKWGNKVTKCNKLFHFRLSQDGFCCIFNYVKQTKDPFNPAENIESKLKFQDSGFSNGLSVGININEEDQFYSYLSSVGVKTHIFHSEDYPDTASGGNIEVLIPIGTETLVGITPTVFQADNNIRKYSSSKRGCIFEDEIQTVLGNYSQSDCMVDCRIDSMLSLCECIPFYIPSNEVQKVCGLTDLPCLRKYKTKWRSLAPYDDNPDEELNKESQDALRCAHNCYPGCESTYYSVEWNSVPLSNDPQDLNARDSKTIAHFFFRKAFVRMYKKDLVFYWFEILSNFGGCFSIMMGLSVISVVEIVVYSTYKIFVRFYHKENAIQ